MDVYCKSGTCLMWRKFSNTVKVVEEVWTLLVTQDFRHMTQERASQFQLSYADSKVLFRIAYGSDKLSPEGVPVR